MIHSFCHYSSKMFIYFQKFNKHTRMSNYNLALSPTRLNNYGKKEKTHCVTNELTLWNLSFSHYPSQNLKKKILYKI